ncbi:hypothetical protein [Desulfoluna butyratoxydans]|uniref:Uncharacterized protein n=1 Tax=Desulfoluna butyratoxydans TaxID=231438 RepID=A0A4U8YSY4_9BACT|nr:hypothetical protein [Desulfoluna butyratoxydans]VFQ46627.1 hypothetical protein MSL71_42970 [Desulfoluna butyratoxydans]
MRTIPMQYYGYGSARITMPGTVARGARREWLVSPSLMLLLISLTCFAVHKLLFNEPLSLTRSRTIIVIPRTEPLPEPTVEKKISFFKVVKDAAKKRAEPRKKELKRIMEPPAALPKEPPLPVKAKPRLLVPPPKMPLAPPPKALATPAPAHRPQPEMRPPTRMKPTPAIPAPHTPSPRSMQPVTRELKPKAAPVLSTAQPQPLALSARAPRQPLRDPAPHRPHKAVPEPKAALSPVITKPAHKAPATVPETLPQKRFTPLALSDAPAAMPMGRSKTPSPSPALGGTPRRSGPAPVLTQLAAPSVHSAAPPTSMEAPGPRRGAALKGLAPAPTQGPAALPLASASAGTTPTQGESRPRRPSLTALPEGLPTGPVPTPSAGETPDIHTLVTIRGSTLDHSLRVTSLKEEIYRKARHMSPEKSPYTFRIRGYTCTVVIQNGAPPTALLSFEPNDATFEVVSALERSLPRRTM